MGLTNRISPFLHWSIFVFTFLMGIETGAGLFTTVVVFPVWASSPEAAIGFTPEAKYYLEEGNLFMYTSTLLTLSSIVTLIAAIRAPKSLRKWLLVTTILFLAVAVWSFAYFIPVQDTTFKGEVGSRIPIEELANSLRNFVLLNYVRQAMLIIGFIIALHSLGLSYALRQRTLHA